MYFLLILFFTSLFGITFMIGRKLVLLKNGEILISSGEELFKTSHLDEWKRKTIKNLKRYVYIMLVIIVRLYVKFSDFFKNKYQEIKKWVKTRNKINSIDGEKKEISKFLKIISEYKSKIRAIKYRIKEEEKEL